MQIVPTIKPINHKVYIPAGLALFACLVFLYLALGLFVSLYGIKKAIETKSPTRFERYVDFPELQNNIKQKYRKQAAKALGFENVEADNLLSRFALQLSEQFIDLSVQSLVNPTGLSLLLSGADINELVLNKAGEKVGESAGVNIQGNDLSEHQIEPEQKNTIAKSDASFLDLLEASRFSYRSHNHFIFEFDNKKEQDAGMQMVFHRQGIRWKLINVIFDE